MLNIFLKKYILLNVALTLSLVMIFTTSQALASEDPFGAPPKETSPNCGPEHRLKLDIVVSSKAKFIECLRNIESYVRDNGVRQWVKFDSFKKKGSAEVDWKALEEAIKVSIFVNRTVYSVEYTPNGCSPSQKFTIKITNDGYMSLYGCCGK